MSPLQGSGCSPRVDFGGFRVRHAANLLDSPVSFRLDLIQVTHAITTDSGGLAVAFRQEAFRDVPPFADHSVVDLRAHAFIVVDPLKPNIEQFDTKHSNFLRSLGKDFLLHQFASLLYWYQRPHIHPSRIARDGVAQRNAILGGADDLNQFMFGDGVTGLAA